MNIPSEFGIIKIATEVADLEGKSPESEYQRIHEIINICQKTTSFYTFWYINGQKTHISLAKKPFLAELPVF